MQFPNVAPHFRVVCVPTAVVGKYGKKLPPAGAWIRTGKRMLPSHCCLFRRASQLPNAAAHPSRRLTIDIARASSAPQLVSLPLARKLLDRAAPPSAWAVSAEQFQIALERSAAQRFAAASPAASILEKYLDTLNLADLALATACSAGNSAAWDFFVANFRPELYRAARAIVGGSLSGSGAGSDAAESGARDLADSLYADLYGLRESEGQRKSLVRLFSRPQQAHHVASRHSRAASSGPISPHSSPRPAR